MEKPHAVRGLVDGHLDRGARDRRRHGHGAAVDLHLGHVQLEHREAAHGLGDPRRELHPALVLVVGVGRDHHHVAQDGVVDPRLDLLDQVAGADGRPRPEPTFPHDLERGAAHRHLVGDRGLHDAVRADPQVVLVGRRRRPGRAALRVDDVPGLVAAHAAGPPHLADRGNRAAALRLRPAQVVVEAVRRAGIVVRAGVPAEIQLGPGLPGRVGLPHRVRVPAARDLDAVDFGDAHRLRHGVEVGPRDRRPRQDRHHGQSDQSEPRRPHGGSSRFKRIGGFEVARREPDAGRTSAQAHPQAERPARPDGSRRCPESARRRPDVAPGRGARGASPVRGLDRRGGRPRGRRAPARLRSRSPPPARARRRASRAPARGARSARPGAPACRPG